MSQSLLPARHCPACGRGHFVRVRFCPFCGAAQVDAREPAPPPPPVAPAVPEPVVFRLEAAPARPVPSPVAPAASPAPQIARKPPPAPPPPAPARVPPRRRFRLRLRHAVLAVLAIAALAALAMGRRETLPAPARVSVGPAWTAVALARYRAVPLLRLTAEAPFSLRLDGERVMRVAPGSGAAVRPGTLRGLELRSGRGQVTVTLTPRGE